MSIFSHFLGLVSIQILRACLYYPLTFLTYREKPGSYAPRPKGRRKYLFQKVRNLPILHTQKFDWGRGLDGLSFKFLTPPRGTSAAIGTPYILD